MDSYQRWKPLSLFSNFDKKEVDDMHYGQEVELSSEAFNSKVVSQNASVVQADERTLQIDIDSEEDFVRWQRAHAMLSKVIDLSDSEVTISKSGLPHRHITIHLKNQSYSLFERIALQVCLGSDLWRETLNLYRALKGLDNVCFFEKKEWYENPEPRLNRMLRPIEI